MWRAALPYPLEPPAVSCFSRCNLDTIIICTVLSSRVRKIVVSIYDINNKLILYMPQHLKLKCISVVHICSSAYWTDIFSFGLYFVYREDMKTNEPLTLEFSKFSAL
ncbi:hypothetical protein KIL84_013674 [Mauremys mutica]|uniref:Uncharacterized protein n=1 Tax=Mauremys mutica TaxID=74926 RepID=A0A9D3WVV4_9SAUR|nr:hypothetical protein KIL84_013674 [Mauremys mutica]